MSVRPGETLIKQGAEALALKSTLPGTDVVALRKHRPAKSYRLPELDRKLTRQRITAEARLLQVCKDAGIDVPQLMRTEPANGDLYMEFVEGRSVRDVLRESTSIDEAGGMMRDIGHVIAQLHILGVIHGDLTTSNLLVREPSGSICIIDFGLGSRSRYPWSGEAPAVDLYVLERAFVSTHPGAAHLFGQVLSSYEETYVAAGKQDIGKAVMKRLEIVRMRGRKRSMVG
ncbi:serine/threonine-protein kinase bud32 [Savitreella phatthalungensis]